MELLFNPDLGITRYAIIAVILILTWMWRLYHFIDRF